MTYGPDNPHPLSHMKTELVWEGKYDQYGNRRTVDTAGLALPLQKIETIDEPRSRAAASGQLALFDKEMSGKRHDDFRNMLVWGDNKLAMASLLRDFTTWWDETNWLSLVTSTLDSNSAPRTTSRAVSPG